MSGGAERFHDGFTFSFLKDKKTLEFLKNKFPLTQVMFVCNKVDITRQAQKYDKRSGDRKKSHKDDDDEGEDENQDDDDEEGEEEEEEEEQEEQKEEEEKEKESDRNACQSKKSDIANDKGEAVFNQLNGKYLLGDSWETCPLFHAISAREVREERLKKREGEATRRFRLFLSSLENHLGKVIKSQTSRVVRKLVLLQESFSSAVQVERTSITQQASVVPLIKTKAAEVCTKMIQSLSSAITKSEEAKYTILEDLKTIRTLLLHDAEEFKVEKPESLQREFQTMVITELPSLSEALLNPGFDIALAKFVSEMKRSILAISCQTLDTAVNNLMKDYVNDLTLAIDDFHSVVKNPMVSRILEDIYDIQFLAAKAETDQLLQVVLNGLLDSMREVSSVALRKGISEPLSQCLCPQDLASYPTVDVSKISTRLNICETLLAMIDFKSVVDSVREACAGRLLEMHEKFKDALSSFTLLQAAFCNSNMSSQLECFRVHFTPQIRKLTVEGMALQYLQTFGPVEFGSLVAKTRHGVIYDCTSENWCGASPTGQCVVKVLDKTDLSEGAWSQNAVNLVNMM